MCGLFARSARVYYNYRARERWLKIDTPVLLLAFFTAADDAGTKTYRAQTAAGFQRVVHRHRIPPHARVNQIRLNGFIVNTVKLYIIPCDREYIIHGDRFDRVTNNIVMMSNMTRVIIHAAHVVERLFKIILRFTRLLHVHATTDLPVNP